MQLSLNGATTMKADLETDIRVAAAAGFACLEIWAAKLAAYLKSHNTRSLRQLFGQYQLQPLSINSVEHINFRTPQDYSGIQEQVRHWSRIAAELACPYLVVVPSPKPDHAVSRQEIIEETVRVLHELADIAWPSGVKLAFEFIGMSQCTVPTLALSQEIVSRVNRPEVGMNLDTFHFFAGGSSLSDINRVTAEKLFIFHINDCEDLPKDQLTDAHRLLPGLGVIPVRQIADALRAAGFDGPASVEIFRPEYWEWDPARLARQAMQASCQTLGL